MPDPSSAAPTRAPRPAVRPTPHSTLSSPDVGGGPTLATLKALLRHLPALRPAPEPTGDVGSGAETGASPEADEPPPPPRVEVTDIQPSATTAEREKMPPHIMCAPTALCRPRARPSSRGPRR